MTVDGKETEAELRHCISEMKKKENHLHDCFRRQEKTLWLYAQKEMQFTKFIDMLVKEGRVTKEELKAFFPTRKEVMQRWGKKK